MGPVALRDEPSLISARAMIHMDENNFIKTLLLATALSSALTACADEETIQSCSAFSDTKKTSVLRNELDKMGVPYRVDGESICVSSDYRSQFIKATLIASPPNPNVAKRVIVPLSPSGAPVQSTQLADMKQQEIFEAELKKRNIWFSKDDTGMIWYEVTREKEVKEITFHIVDSVVSQDIPVGRNIGFSKKAYVDTFTKLLDEKHIKYISKNKNGTYYVVWEEKDSNQVKPLIDEAHKRIIESGANH